MSALLQRVRGHVKLDNGSDDEDDNENCINTDDNTAVANSLGGTVHNSYSNTVDCVDSPSKDESTSVSISQSSVTPISPGSKNHASGGRLIKALKGLKDMSLTTGTASPRIVLIRRQKSGKSLKSATSKGSKDSNNTSTDGSGTTTLRRHGSGGTRTSGYSKDKEAILHQFQHMATKIPNVPLSPTKSESMGKTPSSPKQQADGQCDENHEIVRISKKKKSPSSRSLSASSVDGKNKHGKEKKEHHVTSSGSGDLDRRKVGMSSASLSTRSMSRRSSSHRKKSLLNHHPISIGTGINSNVEEAGGALSVVSHCTSESPLLGYQKGKNPISNSKSSFQHPAPLISSPTRSENSPNKKSMQSTDVNNNKNKGTAPTPILRQSKWSTKNNINANLDSVSTDVFESFHLDADERIPTLNSGSTSRSSSKSLKQNTITKTDDDAWNVESFNHSFGTTNSKSQKSSVSSSSKKKSRNQEVDKKKKSSNTQQSTSSRAASTSSNQSNSEDDDNDDDSRTAPSKQEQHQSIVPHSSDGGGTIDAAAVSMLQHLTPQQQELFLSYAANAIVQTLMKNEDTNSSNENNRNSSSRNDNDNNHTARDLSPTPSTSSYTSKKRILRKKVTTTSELYYEEEEVEINEQQQQQNIGKEDRLAPATGIKNKHHNVTSTSSTKKKEHQKRTNSSSTNTSKEHVPKKKNQDEKKIHQHQTKSKRQIIRKSTIETTTTSRDDFIQNSEVEYDNDGFPVVKTINDHVENENNTRKGGMNCNDQNFYDDTYEDATFVDDNVRRPSAATFVDDDNVRRQSYATFVNDGRHHSYEYNEETEEDDDDDDDDDDVSGDEEEVDDDNEASVLEQLETSVDDNNEFAAAFDKNYSNDSSYYDDYNDNNFQETDDDEFDDDNIWNVESFHTPSNTIRNEASSTGGGGKKPSRLYEYAQQCEWDLVSKECKTNPTEARYVSEIDGGYTALHLAVISRSNPRSLYSEDDQTNLDDIIPASLQIIEELIKACPEAAIIRCSRKRYTPLTYACTAPSATFKYDMKDVAAMIQIILKYAPHSAMVFTDDELSPLDVHIVSYSRRVHEERRIGTNSSKKNGVEQRRSKQQQQSSSSSSSTAVIQALLESTQALAEARSHKGSIQGPVELLYRCNMKEFKKRSEESSSKTNNKNSKGASSSGGSVSTSSSKLSQSLEEWWAWEWTLVLLKYALLGSSAIDDDDDHADDQSTDKIPFRALHAAAKLTACPIPVLTLALNGYPEQIEERSPKDDLYNFPLHDVCSWVSNNEIISSDPFILRRKEKAIHLLLDAFPKVARMTNNMGETPLQLAIETCTPWDQGLSILVRSCPSTLKFPRHVLDGNRNENGALSKAMKLMHDGENESLYSDDEDYWIDPMESIEGMYPFMIAAVLSYIPECRLRCPPSATIMYHANDDANNNNNNSTNSSTVQEDDRTKIEQHHKKLLEIKDLQSLQTIYGLLRARPSVLQSFIDDEKNRIALRMQEEEEEEEDDVEEDEEEFDEEQRMDHNEDYEHDDE